jgi:hypothetical protein
VVHKTWPLNPELSNVCVAQKFERETPKVATAFGIGMLPQGSLTGIEILYHPEGEGIRVVAEAPSPAWVGVLLSSGLLDIDPQVEAVQYYARLSRPYPR